MAKTGIIRHSLHEMYTPMLISNSQIRLVKTPRAGIFYPLKGVGETVRQGDVLGRVMGTLEGEMLSELTAPADGVVFARHAYPLTYQNTVLFRIVTP